MSGEKIALNSGSNFTFHGCAGHEKNSDQSIVYFQLLSFLCFRLREEMVVSTAGEKKNKLYSQMEILFLSRPGLWLISPTEDDRDEPRASVKLLFHLFFLAS